MADWMDELERLAELRDKGLITEEEFEAERVKIIPSASNKHPEDKANEYQKYSEKDTLDEKIVKEKETVEPTEYEHQSALERLKNKRIDEEGSTPFSSMETNPFTESFARDRFTGIARDKFTDKEIEGKSLAEQKYSERKGCLGMVILGFISIIIIGGIIGALDDSSKDNSNNSSQARTENNQSNSSSNSGTSSSGNSSSSNSAPLCVQEFDEERVGEAIRDFSNAENVILSAIGAKAYENTIRNHLETEIRNMEKAVAALDSQRDHCSQVIQSYYDGIVGGLREIIIGYRTLESYYRTKNEDLIDRSVNQVDNATKKVEANFCNLGDELGVRGIRGSTFSC